MHHHQLCSAAGVATRWTRGRVTARPVRAAAENAADRQYVVNLGENCWSFMRSTAAYWRHASAELFAMVRSLGPATWFMTFSANDMGWDDLAVALHDWEGQEWANGGIPPPPGGA